MAIILAPFAVLATIGLVLSLTVHVSSLLGMPSPLGEASWALHIGVFVVWFPAVLASRGLVKDFKQEDFWKAALRACPTWMKYMTSLFFVYAIVNFLTFMLLDVGGGKIDPGSGGTPSSVLRGFSGHWMAFYSAAMALLYSRIHVAEHDAARRCPDGHPVSPSAKFCEECGAEMVERGDPPRTEDFR
jgi:hypothetical protein